jgi:hypothetical protein
MRFATVVLACALAGSAAPPARAADPEPCDGADGAPGADGADGISDYLRVTGTASASNSNSPKTVSVDCTGGRKVLSGGHSFTASSGGLVVRESRATDDDTWTVIAEEVDSVGGSWSVQAFAVCATAN